jgi:hypothetical protein
MKRSLITLARVALVAAAVTACALPTSTPPSSNVTMTAGWERHFVIDWTVDPAQGGARLVHGFITSQTGERVESMRLLAQALDASGAVVGQEIAWLPSGLNSSQRAYFEIGRLPSAAQYRVSVWDYSFYQGDGGGFL